MNLSMAIWVKQYAVFLPISPSIYPSDDMVIVPPGQLGNLLVADGTKPALLFPKVDELSFPFQVVYHLNAQAFFKVHFPCGVVWVRIPFDFPVPFNWHCMG